MNLALDSAATANVYRLLARLSLREADIPLLESLVHGAMSDAFRSVGGVAPSDVSAEVVEELAFDYCRLFIGPSDHFPPYQSVWTSGLFSGEPVSSMRTYVTAVRYAYDDETPMLDHLGVQLDVMATILGQCESTDAVMRQAAHEIRVRYFAEHLTWPDRLLDAAISRAETTFYQSVLQMTREFLRIESEQIESS